MCFFRRKKSIPVVADVTDICLSVLYKKVMGKNWCLPACAQMILAYYGMNIAQSIIANRVVVNGEPSTFRLLSYARGLGYEADWKRIPMVEIENYLKKGIPLIVLQKYSLNLPYEHSRVIFGFDKPKQELTLHDPSGRSNYKISYKEFFGLNFSASEMSQIVILKK